VPLTVTDGGDQDLARMDANIACAGYQRPAPWSTTPLGFVAWVEFDRGRALANMAALDLLSADGLSS